MFEIVVRRDGVEVVVENEVEMVVDLVVIVENRLVDRVVGMGMVEVVDDGDRGSESVFRVGVVCWERHV